jgi:CubicO group peptidase (beta-lactamase class C family)
MLLRGALRRGKSDPADIRVGSMDRRGFAIALLPFRKQQHTVMLTRSVRKLLTRSVRTIIWGGHSLLLACAVFTGGFWFTASPVAAQGVDAKAVDAVIREGLKAWQVPGAALAIVKDNEVVYLKAFGVKDLESKEPVTPDTLFPIASCTKAFTTTAMAMLVDDGKMDWDDPVRKHLDYFHLSDPLADANLSLRDLVTHRTGVSGHDLLWYRAPWSREEIIRRIGHVKPKHSFRSAFQYQSIMFMAAGSAVEAASQMKWEDFVKTRIFDPLGMTASTFTSTAALKAPDHASPHRRNRAGDPAVIPWYPLTTPDPAGSICANARDLARWVQFQLGDGTFTGKRLVSAKNLAETHSPQMVVRLEGPARDLNPDTNQMNYGMAWVLQDYRGHFLVSHAGAIDGFRTHITLVPNRKLGLVILNNLHGSQMNLAVSNQLVDLLLGLPQRNWNELIMGQVRKSEAAAAAKLRDREAKRRLGTKPSRPLVDYTGTYQDPAYGSATVTLVNSTLMWEWSTFKAELNHFQDDTFTVANDVIGYPQCEFTLTKKGEVATMKFLEVLEVDFQKTKRP